MTAAIDTGLRLDALTEWVDEAFDARGGLLTREDDGRYRLRLGGQPLPLTFSLRASRE